MKNSSHIDTAKAVVAFFIVLVAFGVLMLFYNNSSDIIDGGGYYSFITLTVIAFSLLLGLMYLINNSKHPSIHKASAKKHKKVRSRR